MITVMPCGRLPYCCRPAGGGFVYQLVAAAAIVERRDSAPMPAVAPAHLQRLRTLRRSPCGVSGSTALCVLPARHPRHSGFGPLDNCRVLGRFEAGLRWRTTAPWSGSMRKGLAPRQIWPTGSRRFVANWAASVPKLSTQRSSLISGWSKTTVQSRNSPRCRNSYRRSG